MVDRNRSSQREEKQKKTIIQSPKRAKDPQPEKENPLTGKLSRSNDRRYYTTKRDGNRRLKSPATRTVVLFKRNWWEKFGLLKVGRITRHFSQSKHTAANNSNEKPNHRKFWINETHSLMIWDTCRTLLNSICAFAFYVA